MTPAAGGRARRSTTAAALSGANLRDPIPPTIEWRRGRIRMIDQRVLPGRLRFLTCRTVDELCDAIRSLAVRGAPALGAAGAFGVALAARDESGARAGPRVRASARRIVATRPTAVNLAWGVGQALAAFEAGGAPAALGAARVLAERDVQVNRALGAHGAPLLRQRARVLTHCNAGSLATVGYGTAIGVIRAAEEAGRRPRVWVDETRPVLQGARLTAWELDRLGIEATLIPDSAAGSLMAAGEVDLVVVGADRVCANGDVANKIGTYSLAVLARHHGVPFYVAAPISTVDLATPDGASVIVEMRDPGEVTNLLGVRIAPDGFDALNPAFDVTPARLVSALITELGVIRPPYRRALARLTRAAPG